MPSRHLASILRPQKRHARVANLQCLLKVTVLGIARRETLQAAVPALRAIGARAMTSWTKSTLPGYIGARDRHVGFFVTAARDLLQGEKMHCHQ